MNAELTTWEPKLAMFTSIHDAASHLKFTAILETFETVEFYLNSMYMNWC
jgi:hypothetical protein